MTPCRPWPVGTHTIHDSASLTTRLRVPQRVLSQITVAAFMESGLTKLEDLGMPACISQRHNACVLAANLGMC